MNQSESQQHGWSDQELEEILQDFFEHELPDQFDITLAASCSVADGSGGPPRRTIRRTAALIAGIVAAVGFVVSLLWVPRGTRQTDHRIVIAPILDLPSESVSDHDRPAVVVPTMPVAFDDLAVAVYADSEPLDWQIYETASGPVEQRTDVAWTNLSYYEPETGANVEWWLPELTIEITPLSK
jgi:hypothetical protein